MERHSIKAKIFTLIVATTHFLFVDQAKADETSEAIAQIKVLGGTVLKSRDGLEIGFHLKGRKSADQALIYVAKLNNVCWLNLRNTNVTDKQLARLKKLSSLRWLHLEKTNITDEGVKHLIDLKNLEYLNLYSTQVSDKSVGVLSSLPKLKKLYVWQTKITARGMEVLKTKRPQLKVVSGLDLSQLAEAFPSEAEEAKPKLKLSFVLAESRNNAPVRSDNGVNCQLWFENSTDHPIKVYWIGYGAGDLKYYFTLKPNEIRKQNSYSRNAWLITDEKENAIGYFVAKDDDARAIIPKP